MFILLSYYTGTPRNHISWDLWCVRLTKTQRKSRFCSDSTCLVSMLQWYHFCFVIRLHNLRLWVRNCVRFAGNYDDKLCLLWPSDNNCCFYKYEWGLLVLEYAVVYPLFVNRQIPISYTKPVKILTLPVLIQGKTMFTCSRRRGLSFHLQGYFIQPSYNCWLNKII